MLIPKKIHLTCKYKDITNNIYKSCYNKYKELYPEYEIILYDNNDIYNIVKSSYPQFYEDIKKINIGAILADVFRYLILYLEGGIYSDMDCEPIKNIAPLFNNYFYHGDNNQTYVLYNENIELKNICISDFHMHPCNNYETISDNNNIYKCNGHSTNNTDILVGYEFFKPKQIQICQWFIVSMPRQKVLLDCFLECMSNINILQTLTKNMPNYQKIVLKTSGPIMFTNKINNDRLSKITILPETYFCAGSGNYVPFTKNSYVRHHFVGSWR